MLFRLGMQVTQCPRWIPVDNLCDHCCGKLFCGFSCEHSSFPCIVLFLCVCLLARAPLLAPTVHVGLKSLFFPLQECIAQAIPSACMLNIHIIARERSWFVPLTSVPFCSPRLVDILLSPMLRLLSTLQTQEHHGLIWTWSLQFLVPECQSIEECLRIFLLAKWTESSWPLEWPELVGVVCPCWCCVLWSLSFLSTNPFLLRAVIRPPRVVFSTHPPSHHCCHHLSPCTDLKAVSVTVHSYSLGQFFFPVWEQQEKRILCNIILILLVHTFFPRTSLLFPV